MKTKTKTETGPEVEAGQAAKTTTPRVKSPAVVEAERVLAEAKAAAKAARAAERAAKPKAEPRPTCTSLKADGTACTAKAKAGQTTCVDHAPAWERLTEEERAAWSGLCANPKGPQYLAGKLGWHQTRAILAAIGGDPEAK